MTTDSLKKDVPEVTVKLADYLDSADAKDLITVLDNYASSIMGGASPLAPRVKENLCGELARLPHAFSLLLHVDDQIAGIANCFEGFSTFACRKLTNIHDIAILPQFRGMQLSQRLLAAIESEARSRGCVKLTLEVLEGNQVARNAYAKFGFAAYELDDTTGAALFLQKYL